MCNVFFKLKRIINKGEVNHLLHNFMHFFALQLFFWAGISILIFQCIAFCKKKLWKTVNVF